MVAENRLVSVVIPCYNAEKFIRPAIDSIINQTYRNLEILLIDDGSTDSTPEILNHYARADARVKVIRNSENRKLIYTLNRGVAQATGYYLARMDADDISDLTRIEKQVNFMTQHPELDGCSTGYLKINVNGKELTFSNPKALNNTALKFISFFSTPLSHAALLAKTQVMKENPYDPEFIHSEDYELFSRMIFKGYRFANINEHLASFRENPASVSYKFENIQIETHTKISRRNILQYFGELPDFFVHKVLIYRIAFRPSINQVNRALDLLNRYKEIFFERENCTPEERDEIEHFLIEHRMDMLIQSFKASGIAGKFRLFPLLYRHRHLLYSDKGKSYFSSKLKRKKTGSIINTL
jgi:Glycosyltransferases involved in cell wall biogenesis